MTADLSALGGPAEVELTPLGDGEYGLEVELVAGEVGRRDIVIRVEQRAGERTEVAALPPAPCTCCPRSGATTCPPA